MCISGSNAGYTMFRGSVKSNGYPFHSPVFSPSLPLPCVTVCNHISTGIYCVTRRSGGRPVLGCGDQEGCLQTAVSELCSSVETRGDVTWCHIQTGSATSVFSLAVVRIVVIIIRCKSNPHRFVQVSLCYDMFVKCSWVDTWWQ